MQQIASESYLLGSAILKHRSEPLCTRRRKQYLRPAAAECCQQVSLRTGQPLDAGSGGMGYPAVIYPVSFSHTAVQLARGQQQQRSFCQSVATIAQKKFAVVGQREENFIFIVKMELLHPPVPVNAAPNGKILAHAVHLALSIAEDAIKRKEKSKLRKVIVNRLC